MSQACARFVSSTCFSDRATSRGTTHRCVVCARAFLSKSAAPSVPVAELRWCRCEPSLVQGCPHARPTQDCQQRKHQGLRRDARTRGQPSHGHGQSKSFARSVSPSRCPHSEWVKLLIHMACCSAFEVFLGRLITTDAAVLARMWCSRSSRRCAPVSPGEAVKQVMNDRGPDHSKRRTGTGRTTLAWCLLASWLVASGGVLLAHMKNNPVDVCVTRN